MTDEELETEIEEIETPLETSARGMTADDYDRLFSDRYRATGFPKE